MSKMNDLYLAENEAAWDEYVESMRDDLRQEGAEELRVDILRELDVRAKRAASTDEKLAYQTAITVVERATR